MAKKLLIRDLTLRGRTAVRIRDPNETRTDRSSSTVLQGCEFLCDGGVGWCRSRFGDAVSERKPLGSSRKDKSGSG